jgi:ribulose-5-phosphate 4-epimerase/fuculose-1-phosphate aldolase
MKEVKRKYAEYKDLFYSEQVQQIAKTICELAQECWELGLSDSTGFSISQIIPDTSIVITDKSGTGFRRNKISLEDLILIDLEGNLIYKPENSSNDRLAPVNVVIHLEGYKICPAQGCIHWHDPYTLAFAAQGLTIKPFTLQSKLIGEVPCVMVDDRKEKKYMEDKCVSVEVPTGLHSRPDVYFVMKKVGIKAAQILESRKTEFEKHGIVITHFEHGLFSWGRSVEEAFENAYRSFRNTQALLLSKLV